jgi:hypothetical protein
MKYLLSYKRLLLLICILIVVLEHCINLPVRAATRASESGKITFIREIGGTREICTTTPKGIDIECIQTAGSNPSRPKWSPDGQNLAYISS